MIPGTRVGSNRLRILGMVSATVAISNFASIAGFEVWRAVRDYGLSRDLALSLAVYIPYYFLRSIWFAAFAYVARRNSFALGVVSGSVVLHTVLTLLHLFVTTSASSTAGLGIIPLTLLDYTLVALTAAIAWGLPKVSRAV